MEQGAILPDERLPRLTDEEVSQLVGSGEAIHSVEYGDKIRRTFLLMKGQTLNYLFLDGTPAVDVLRGWLDPPKPPKEEWYYQPPPDLAPAQAMIAEIVGNLEDWKIGWTFRELYEYPFPQLPGPEDQKQALLWMFAQLDADFGVDLPFLHLPHGENDPVPMILDNLLFRFGDSELYFFYHEPADLSYGEDILDLVDTAFNSQQGCVLRHTALDLILEVEETEEYFLYSVAPLSSNNMCCNRYTRVCQAGTAGQTCLMCGGYCCLGSSWCSM